MLRRTEVLLLSNNNKNTVNFGGMGVGFVSLIMIFAVICLTVLSVLSYQAAGANDILNDKSAAFTREYYAADSRAKEKLFLLDELALTASDGFFESDLVAMCEEALPEAKLRNTPEGIEIRFTEPVNDRLGLEVSIVFYSFSPDGSRYRIQEWKTVSAADDASDEPLGVWDGSMFN